MIRVGGSHPNGWPFAGSKNTGNTSTSTRPPNATTTAATTAAAEPSDTRCPGLQATPGSRPAAVCPTAAHGLSGHGTAFAAVSAHGTPREAVEEIVMDLVACLSATARRAMCDCYRVDRVGTLGSVRLGLVANGWPPAAIDAVLPELDRYLAQRTST